MSTVSGSVLQQALDTPAVREALEARARRLLPRAQQLAAAQGALAFGRALELRTGVRPGKKSRGGLKRPYARVQATLTDELKAADHAAKMTRRQILRRAARG